MRKINLQISEASPNERLCLAHVITHCVCTHVYKLQGGGAEEIGLQCMEEKLWMEGSLSSQTEGVCFFPGRQRAH